MLQELTPILKSNIVDFEICISLDYGYHMDIPRKIIIVSLYTSLKFLEFRIRISFRGKNWILYKKENLLFGHVKKSEKENIQNWTSGNFSFFNHSSIFTWIYLQPPVVVCSVSSSWAFGPSRGWWTRSSSCIESGPFAPVLTSPEDIVIFVHFLG